MKNPFEKEDNTGIVVAVAVGALAAGALAYLFMTDSGNETIESVKHKIKDQAKDLASGFISDKTGFKKDTVKTAADHIVK